LRVSWHVSMHLVVNWLGLSIVVLRIGRSITVWNTIVSSRYLVKHVLRVQLRDSLRLSSVTWCFFCVEFSVFLNELRRVYIAAYSFSSASRSNKSCHFSSSVSIASILLRSISVLKTCFEASETLLQFFNAFFHLVVASRSSAASNGNKY